MYSFFLSTLPSGQVVSNDPLKRTPRAPTLPKTSTEVDVERDFPPDSSSFSPLKTFTKLLYLETKSGKVPTTTVPPSESTHLEYQREKGNTVLNCLLLL